MTCVEQLKAHLVANRCPGTRSSRYCFHFLEVEDILVALKEIRNLLHQYGPQLLNVFKLKSLLTLVSVQNFFSKMRVDSFDIPLQLQLYFRFRRPLGEHKCAGQKYVSPGMQNLITQECHTSLGCFHLH